LVNLIQAEKSNPQADVFWSSETGRAIALKSADCLAPYQSPNAEGIPAKFKDPEGYWTGFAARARVIIYKDVQLSLEKKLPANVFGRERRCWACR
jgi:iron(III) transport system substrate-binding protein